MEMSRPAAVNQPTMSTTAMSDQLSSVIGSSQWSGDQCTVQQLQQQAPGTHRLPASIYQELVLTMLDEMRLRDALYERMLRDVQDFDLSPMLGQLGSSTLQQPDVASAMAKAAESMSGQSLLNTAEYKHCERKLQFVEKLLQEHIFQVKRKLGDLKLND